ncbi:MAG TPA: hypothetical protein VGH28_28060 [Polyangiaceae bacterium]
MKVRWIAVLAFVAACGPSLPAEDASRAALRAGAATVADPTLTPAHLVPLRAADEGKPYGVEPGCGTRLLVAGVRVIKLAGGGVESASDALPAPPATTVEIPERLGGGFLFVIGPTVYRAASWLAPLEMLYAAPVSPTQLFIGLDRAYLRLSNAAYVAFDPRTGDPMDLGPWPGSPQVSHYVAADGWRAAAIADLRGVVATFDAGNRWQTLPILIEPKNLELSGDAIVVTGVDADGESQSYAVQPNGQIARLQETTTKKHAEPAPEPEDTARATAKNPLASAVLEGWPLAGGTALVARDGALSRVRMSDGTVLDTAPDAFPLKPARCHAVSLSPMKSAGAFGFVCGVPHGATEIYAYDPAGKLVLLRHFDEPRAVFSPSNGTLVVEGVCDPDATPVDIKKTEQGYCIMRANRKFEDFVVNGDVGTERVVPLADGRTAIVSPPVGDLSTGRLTIFDGAKPKTIPLTFASAQAKPAKAKPDEDDEADDTTPDVDDESRVAAVLRSGTWMQGIEERTPGTLSAWVAHSGRYIGLEISLAGAVKHGPFVVDLGTAMVSGRWGLGWTASRQGYETIDGGMTWKPLALPEPLEVAGPAAGAAMHGCGPLGCVLAGWIRVGWGEPPPHAANDVNAQTPRTFDVPSPTTLHLKCEASGKLAPPSEDTSATQTSGYRYGRYGYPYGYGYGYGYNRTPQTIDWQPFFAMSAPKLGTDDLGFSRRVDEIYDRSGTDSGNSGHFTLSALARLYAWGPKGMDWDSHGRFVVRFTSPFDASNVLHATQGTTIPQFIADSTNFVGLGGYPTHPIQYVSMVPGDDASHALMIVQRYVYSPSGSGPETILVDVEADRPALEVRREGGQALGELESAVRMGGRWYLATTDGNATLVSELDSGVARDVVRIPRVGQEAGVRAPALRLARRADGRMLGAIVIGAPITEGAARPSRWRSQAWALPIDVDSGALGDPERLGASDGSGKAVRVCGAQDGGWVVDGRWPGAAITVLGASGAQLNGYSGSGMFARYHVTPTAMCLEKLSLNGYADAPSAGKLGHVDEPVVSASLYIDRARQAFRCVQSR